MTVHRRFDRTARGITTVFACLAAWTIAVNAADSADAARQSLAGEWQFSLDRDDVGAGEQWFSRDLPDRIALPGTLQSQGFGDEIRVDTPWVAALPRDMRWYLLPQYQAYTKPGNVKMPYLSQPRRHYLGVAWYAREIEIPAAWSGKRVVLTLERPRWETTVYVDSRPVGSCRSLVAPHAFDLGAIEPGKHRLSVRVDNRMILPYRPDGHSVSDAQGATWNGIVGKIELSSTSRVWIDEAAAYPDVGKKTVLLKLRIGNATGKSGSGTVAVGDVKAAVQWDAAGGAAEVVVPLGADAKLWSEFGPVVHRLTVRLNGAAADDEADDSHDVAFGLREIRADGKRILLNGTEINFRATHDGGGFPLTGYPATDVETWRRIIGVCKTWGLNGMRFHSWCPPEAAFTAADELGFYMQPECGMWNAFGADGKMLDVLNDETRRLIAAYGNHPSFVLLGATNEPAGAYRDQLPKWDAKWRAADPRRLYADGTGRPVVPRAAATQAATARATQPYPADVIVSAGGGLADRARGPGGWFGGDYEPAVRDVPIPVIGHEVGQWVAYPDFDVIGKFTGHLRPGNFEVMRDSAEAHGLLANNKAIARASGRFQVACYKEEIEANLRTPGMSGIQLLDLHDYLGQGAALVGLLDAFWEPKGYVTSEEFRRFCNTTVPLARLRKRVLTTADPLEADVELAHFGAAPLENLVPEWRIEDVGGTVIAKGEWPARDVPIGKNIVLGRIATDLAAYRSPAAYRLIVDLRGTRFENDWTFWVYPETVDTSAPEGVLTTGSWPEAETRLAAGGKVLFQPAARDLDPSLPKLSTVPVFWNRVMNGGGAWMLGLWCDAAHPALAGFPTGSHCDWQWVDVMGGGRALVLDSLPRDLRPIVQPIDDWSRNLKLGLVYECKVGPGRLVVCALDLDAKRPGSQSLRRSLLDYMAGDRFEPATTIASGDLREQWVTTRRGTSANVITSQPARPPAPEIDAPPEVQIPATNRARP